MGILDSIKNQIKEINTANKNYQEKLEKTEEISNLYAIPPEMEDKPIDPSILKYKNSNINIRWNL